MECEYFDAQDVHRVLDMRYGTYDIKCMFIMPIYAEYTGPHPGPDAITLKGGSAYR